MKWDLLVSKDKRSYFINCRRQNDMLYVGAVYIAPSTLSPMKLFTEEGVSLTIEIPTNAADQSIEMVAMDTLFFIV